MKQKKREFDDRNIQEVIESFVEGRDDKVSRLSSKIDNDVRCLYLGNTLIACNIEGFIFENKWATTKTALDYRKLLVRYTNAGVLYEYHALCADRALIIKNAIATASVELTADTGYFDNYSSYWQLLIKRRIVRNTALLEKFNTEGVLV